MKCDIQFCIIRMQKKLTVLLLMVEVFIFPASSLSCIGGKSVRGLPSITSSSHMNCCDGQVCYSVSEDELPARLENIKNPFTLSAETRRARRAVESKHEDIEIGSGNCPLSISTCRSNQTLIFPVSAISVLKKKRVNVFQHLMFAQPVMFSACVDQTCRILSGKCNQVYIPQPLFVYTSNATIDLEFVYLEHGCECELDRIPQADEIEEPIADYLNGYIQIFRSETKNGTKPGVALQGINLSTVDSSLIGENQDTANDCSNEQTTTSNIECSQRDKSLATSTAFEVASETVTKYQSTISQYLNNNNTNTFSSNEHMEIGTTISNKDIEQNKNAPKPFEVINIVTASVAESQTQSTPLQHLRNNSKNSVDSTENVEIGIITSITDTEKNYNTSPKPFEVLSVATANVTKSQTHLTISQNFGSRSMNNSSNKELITKTTSSPNTETIQVVNIPKTTLKMSQTALPVSQNLENSKENPVKSTEKVATMSTNIPVASTAQDWIEITKQIQLSEIPQLPKNPGDPFLPQKGKFNPLSRMLESYKKRKLS